MKFSDEKRIEKILDYAEFIVWYVSDNKIDRQTIEDNRIIQFTITTPLYNIGEHAYRLTSEYKEKTAHIQWNLIAGLRHRLVHDYDGTNWAVVWDIVQNELPELIKQLKVLCGGDENG